MNCESLSKSEIQHYTNYWCKTKGISIKDIESHPRADDIVLLVAFRDAMWDKLNLSEQGCWAGYWNSVYKKKNKLKIKGLNKLEQITITATQRHLKNIIHQAQLRHRIKALKQNPDSKPMDDIAAKDIGPNQSAPWD
jgi:hypothetical protein